MTLIFNAPSDARYKNQIANSPKQCSLYDLQQVLIYPHKGEIMMLLKVKILLMALILASSSVYAQENEFLGKFNTTKDIFLPQFDSKTDVDDLHSIAAVATMLRHPIFKNVKYHAVAGAYGIQEGLYVPAQELFSAAFGKNWSNAHKNHRKALLEVTTLVIQILDSGGDIWIAEAGQSDFSADLVMNVRHLRPEIDTKSRIHIVQHSEWNQSVTTKDKLAFVKTHTDYHKIEDGNVTGNGTPGFLSQDSNHWDAALNSNTQGLWHRARDISNKYNGADGRYLNQAIKAGGLDFSDTSETCYIFGFGNIIDITEFFNLFGK